jgi:hypothetical protein
MNPSRILLAGLLGGLAMFLWSALTHMATPLGHAGMRGLDAEPQVVSALEASRAPEGLYVFPWQKDGESDDAYGERMASSSFGLLLYNHPRGVVMDPWQLVTEYASNAAAVFVAACLLACTALRSYGARVGFVALLGFLAWLAIEVSYWNWYGFPSSYAAAQLVEQVGGFAVAGLVAAKLVRPAG